MTVKTAKLDEPEDKLRWLFNLFDKGQLILLSYCKLSQFCILLDGSGTIDDEEVYGVVITLFKFTGRDIMDDDLEDIVDDILEKVDANGDGIITQHEFVKFALKSTFLLEVIENHTG